MPVAQGASAPALSITPARSRWPGLALTGALAAIAVAMAQTPWARTAGLSGLTLSILLGIVVGNSVFSRFALRAGPGVDYSRTWLLRAGIVLYGLRITFQQIATVGWAGILIDALMVSLTFLLAVGLGTRAFRMDRQTSMLIGAGSAICGAAAVLAAEPVVRAQAHKVSVAVASVVVFGTIGMFAYPLLYPHLGLTPQAYGVFAGSTIHEVAQVVAAGRSVGEAAASSAVIEKMLRVLMLAPFLVTLSRALARRAPGGQGATRIAIPWFAVAFIAMSGINSLGLVPAAVAGALIRLDTALLAMAMVGLGLRTHAGAVREAGLRPLLLALSLFAFLVLGGYAINWGVMRLLA